MLGTRQNASLMWIIHSNLITTETHMTDKGDVKLKTAQLGDDISYFVIESSERTCPYASYRSNRMDEAEAMFNAVKEYLDS